jgi:hypothetical protein
MKPNYAKGFKTKKIAIKRIKIKIIVEKSI